MAGTVLLLAQVLAHTIESYTYSDEGDRPLPQSVEVPEFSNVMEGKAYMKSIGLGGSVGRIHPKILQRSLKAVNVLSKEYPKIGGKMRYLSTLTGSPASADTPYEQFALKGFQWNQNVVMNCRSDPVPLVGLRRWGLGMNPLYFDTLETAETAVRQMEANGSLPKGCGCVEFNIAHEFGHAVTNTIFMARGAPNITAADHRVKQIVIEADTEDCDKWQYHMMRTNCLETLAHAFGAMYYCDDPVTKNHPIVGYVKDMLDDHEGLIK